MHKLSFCWAYTYEPLHAVQPSALRRYEQWVQPATVLQIASLRFFLDKQIPFLPGFVFFFCIVCEKGGKDIMIFLLYKMSMIYTFSIGSHIRWLPSNGFGRFVLDRANKLRRKNKNNDQRCINKFKDKRFWFRIPIGARSAGDCPERASSQHPRLGGDWFFGAHTIHRFINNAPSSRDHLWPRNRCK